MTTDVVRPRLGVGVLSIATMLMAACANLDGGAGTGRQLTPEAVVSWWNEARNVGNPAEALTLVAEDGDVLGYRLDDPDQRVELGEVLAAQAEAGWHILDHPCSTTGEVVTCNYVMSDRILRAWGLELNGTHVYTVRDGRILQARRTHDAGSARRVYRALEEFRAWVATHHPDLVTVIWSTPDAAAYTTVDGARAMLSLLDDYTPSSEQ